MSKQNDHIGPLKHLSPEMMEAYLNNELNTKDQHRVEKYLLDHPFEAEAMEGFAAFGGSIKDINFLNDRLDEIAKSEKELQIMPFWKRALPYAAVFLLVITATFLVLYLNPTNESATPISLSQEDKLDLSENEQSLAVQPRQTEDNTQAEKKESVDSQTRQPKKDISNTAKAKSMVTQKSNFSEKLMDHSVLEDEEQAANYEDIGSIEILTESEAPKETLTKNKARAQDNDQYARPLARKMKKSSDNISSDSAKMVSGYVTDAASREALTGVTVINQKTKKAVSTDIDGFFKIEAEQNDILRMAFIGTETKNVTISSDDTLEVALEADIQQLSEVVVTGKGRLRDRPETFTAAKPIDGYRKFRQYIRDNLQFPEEAKEQLIAGRVKLQFTVQPNGKLSDIIILEALCESCYQEAIRLLKAGPDWKPASRNDRLVADTVTISIKFKE